jgi:hypothetical protein
MDKILFLDIDGVLNNESFLLSNAEHSVGTNVADVWEIDPSAITHLNRIVKETNCKIVLSSSWRFNWTAEATQQLLEHNGFNHHNVIIDTTPLVDLICRGDEIFMWLMGEYGSIVNFPKFAIVDDDDDMKKLSDNLFLTNFKNGLTSEIADKIINHLNKT